MDDLNFLSRTTNSANISPNSPFKNSAPISYALTAREIATEHLTLSRDEAIIRHYIGSVCTQYGCQRKYCNIANCIFCFLQAFPLDIYWDKDQRVYCFSVKAQPNRYRDEFFAVAAFPFTEETAAHFPIPADVSTKRSFMRYLAKLLLPSMRSGQFNYRFSSGTVIDAVRLVVAKHLAQNEHLAVTENQLIEKGFRMPLPDKVAAELLLKKAKTSIQSELSFIEPSSHYKKLCRCLSMITGNDTKQLDGLAIMLAKIIVGNTLNNIIDTKNKVTFVSTSNTDFFCEFLVDVFTARWQKQEFYLSAKPSYNTLNNKFSHFTCHSVTELSSPECRSTFLQECVSGALFNIDRKASSDNNVTEHLINLVIGKPFSVRDAISGKVAPKSTLHYIFVRQNLQTKLFDALADNSDIIKCLEIPTNLIYGAYSDIALDTYEKIFMLTRFVKHGIDLLLDEEKDCTPPVSLSREKAFEEFAGFCRQQYPLEDVMEAKATKKPGRTPKDLACKNRLHQCRRHLSALPTILQSTKCPKL